MSSEIAGSKSDLVSMGVTDVSALVYPYGEFNATVKSVAQGAGYTIGRSVQRGFNDKATDKFGLKIQQIDPTVTQAQIRQWIETAVANKTWLILMYHDFAADGGYLSTTPLEFQQTVAYLVTNSVPVVTLKEGVALMAP
jgi:hypothetical protein